jgi:hypothetical protein
VLHSSNRLIKGNIVVKSGNGTGTSQETNVTNGAAAPEIISAFADAEALKKATAAKLGRLKASMEAASTEVILQRPLPTWFFRTPDDDDMLFPGGTWLDPENKELFFVMPNMWGHSQLDGAVRPTLFVPYVTAAIEGPSIHGIWTVSSVLGNTDSIHADVLPPSRTTWVRTWTVQRTKKYRCQKAEEDYGEPTWLPKTIFQLLDIVFPLKRQIHNEEHEVIRRLEGRNRATPRAQMAVDPN